MKISAALSSVETVLQRDSTIQHLFPNKVILYLYMLGPCIKDRILCNSYTTLIVRMNHCTLQLGKTKLPSNLLNQTASHVALQAARYSASVEDRATVGCLLLLHDKAPAPREKNISESRSPGIRITTQSASLHPFKIGALPSPAGYQRPKAGDWRKYLRIRRPASNEIATGSA